MALSVAALDLGVLPTRALARRVVMLTSHTPRPYSFSWSASAAAALEGVLSVEPAVGTIAPYGAQRSGAHHHVPRWCLQARGAAG